MSATSTATPVEVFERFIRHLTAQEWPELFALYAEDAEVEIPFSPLPPRRVRGRAALADRLAARTAADAMQLRAENVRIHRTEDPEVVIAEFDYQVHHPATGNDFKVANVQVMRVRDGLVVETRDYHDHLALARGRGQAGELLSPSLRPGVPPSLEQPPAAAPAQ